MHIMFLLIFFNHSIFSYQVFTSDRVHTVREKSGNFEIGQGKMIFGKSQGVLWWSSIDHTTTLI